ncbi:MAG TPA: alpha-N-arabinofuranosidase [Planctomycetota bacterium]|nr:alpha-N-arabinofuranosidase [Planctomycetota bacterium]
MKATVRFDTQYHAGEIDRRIFSGFLEHLGRAVYEGVYDPGNPLSDENGFRKDVLDALKPMAMPLMRYPGGNFVSCYNWRDGVGPATERKARPDFAWKSIEPNTFGTDQFMQWAKKLGTAPMMAVNLGTCGATEAAALLEYCNMPRGTYWADERAKNGHADPYAVKVWCLGNEMDGPWQAGHVPAEVYAQRADQAGKMMKGLDSSIELVACGSSGRFMNTYMEWDRSVLEYCWEHVDYISAHRYSNNRAGDSAWYLAEGLEIDRIVEDYAALLNYVRALKKSSKRVYLSFDEWNVWYRETNQDGGWKIAPHLLEEVYNLEDALVCAQYLSSFVRHADTVKMACLAQIVNVIAPILTRKDGLLLQSIYYPFVAYAQYARGKALTPVVNAPLYKAGERGEAPMLDASATYDTQSGGLALFFVNRDQHTDLTVEVSLADASISKIGEVQVLTGTGPKAANSWEQPHAIKPASGEGIVIDNGHARIRVPKLAFVCARGIVSRK